MPTEDRIAFVAAFLVRIYGSAAELEVARKVAEKRERGDSAAEKTWLRVWGCVARAELASRSSTAA